MITCKGASVCLVEWIFFLYKIGESLLDATTRPYIIQAVCSNLFRDNLSTCDSLDRNPEAEDRVQKMSARYIMFHRVVLYLPAITLGLFCGAWSDRFGRKIPIIFPGLGSVVGVLLYLGSLVSQEWTMELVLLGGFIQGAFGKSSVITMAVNSYATDITEKEQRTRKLGKLLAMNFFGLFAGSLLSGVLLDTFGVEVNFCCVSALHGLAILVAVLFLGETVVYQKEENEDVSECAAMFRLSNVKESFMVLCKKRENGVRPIIVTLFLISILQITCKTGEMDTTVLFVQHRPLNWPESGYGYLLSVDYAIMGICLFFILPLLSNFFRVSDTFIIMLGIVCRIMRLLWAGFLRETWMVYASVAVGAMGGLMISAMRSLLSKSVTENEIGKTFSLLASGETASKLLGSAIFANLYSATVSYLPGFVYLMEAVIYFLTLLVMVWVDRKLKSFQMYKLVSNSSPKKTYHTQDSANGQEERCRRAQSQRHSQFFPSTTP